MSALGRLRDATWRRLLGIDVRRLNVGVEELQDRLDHWQARVGALETRNRAQIGALRDHRDATPLRMDELRALRGTAEYSRRFADPEPLISVRIASYRKTDELLDVAIASVLSQSYQNFEIVIVNDGPNDRTRSAIEKLGDRRIRYHEFAERKSYPDDDHHRWMVAGSPGMNHAAELASGVWLAPLDDDDAFAPDHLEKLLNLAVESDAELAYGAVMQKNLVNGTEALIWSSPPAISQFSFQGAIYLRLLHQVFRYDTASWLVEEPGDWNLIRRMCAAGVVVAGIPDVVAVMNQVPYTHKDAE